MRRLLAAAAVVAITLLAAGSAEAGLDQGGVVLPRPLAGTPNILDGAVSSIAVVGDTVIAGGTFTNVDDTTTGSRVTRYGVLAYQLATGHVLDFDPLRSGRVDALAAGPTGTVYAAGSFTLPGTTNTVGLAQFDLATGRPVDGFLSTVAAGKVRTMASWGPWLYVGGSFTTIGGRSRAGLARLATVGGAVDAGFDLHLARSDHATVKVEAVAVSPYGSRVAAAGAFDTSGGARRRQLVLAETGGATAKVAGWYTDAYSSPCKSLYDSYLRGVDFAPDGSYLAVAATGGMTGPQRMCDSAARFNLDGTGEHRPVWVNRTGGNTLWSVAVTDAAVYVGGHQQWVDNPHGHKDAGPGAVSRPGIAALDPETGHALDWNPTHSRGVGVGVLVACSDGLLVGSDTDQLGGTYHGRIGMLPAPGPPHA